MRGYQRQDPVIGAIFPCDEHVETVELVANRFRIDACDTDFYDRDRPFEEDA